MTDYDPEDDIPTAILPPGDKTPEILRLARARLAELELHNGQLRVRPEPDWEPRYIDGCPDCFALPCRCHEHDHMPGKL